MNDVALDFNRIHADYRPKIHRYLARMVGEADAEDLTQEVLLKISRALDSFRRDSNLSTWIYRIATNTAVDRLRAPAFKRTRDNQSLDEASAGEELCAGSACAAPSLEEQVQRQERYACYSDFIQRLPLNYRMVVALSELEDLAVQEIADILGLGVDVVKIRLHRGRMKLWQALKDHCNPVDWL